MTHEEARLLVLLEKALVIIVGEYPKGDERYQWAVCVAEQFDLDLGENGVEPTWVRETFEKMGIFPKVSNEQK